MIFAILFILAFLIGLVVYLLTDKWIVGVGLSVALFVLTTLTDSAAQDGWMFTLIFGLPIVFVASLLGAYVVAIRRDDGEELLDGVDEGASELSDDRVQDDVESK